MLLDDIKKQILNKNKIQHAILFFGDDNKGFEAAIYISKLILCQDELNKPCEKCKNCNRIKKNIHPDVKVISSDQAKNSFHVDKIREIKSDAYTMPYDGKYKIYILKNAQNMTIQAQNAILKLLEEPPENVIFILTCNNKQELLPTILSRCNSFNVGFKDNIETEKVKEISNKLLSAIINGSFEFFIKTSILLKEKDKTEILNITSSIINDLDNTLRYKANSTGEFKDIEKKLASTLSLHEIVKLEKIFLNFKKNLEMNANKNILITNLSVEVSNIIEKGRVKC